MVASVWYEAPPRGTHCWESGTGTALATVDYVGQTSPDMFVKKQKKKQSCKCRGPEGWEILHQIDGAPPSS